MEAKIKLQAITIKDKNGGKEFTIKTVRTLEEVVNDIEDLEKEALENKMRDAVIELY